MRMSVPLPWSCIAAAPVVKSWIELGPRSIIVMPRLGWVTEIFTLLKGCVLQLWEKLEPAVEQADSSALLISQKQKSRLPIFSPDWSIQTLHPACRSQGIATQLPFAIPHWICQVCTSLTSICKRSKTLGLLFSANMHYGENSTRCYIRVTAELWPSRLTML